MMPPSSTRVRMATKHRRRRLFSVQMRLHFVVFAIFVPTAWASSAPYAGVIGGIATLSADAGSQTTPQGLALSSYSPDTGGALDVFAGAHLDNYFSLQANYTWNENDLLLSSASAGSNTFYRQARSSSQSAGILDFLIYFRRRNSRIRPYLGTGTGVIHLTSREGPVLSSSGSPSLPPPRFSSTNPVLRSHVGIDLRISRPLSFRYSFSEFIGRNEISKQLSPPGSNKLQNFQNLFGFVWCFR